jgi:hypothetical protein
LRGGFLRGAQLGRVGCRQRQAGCFQDCVQIAGRLLRWRRSRCFWRWRCHCRRWRGDWLSGNYRRSYRRGGFDRLHSGCRLYHRRGGDQGGWRCFDHWRRLGWRYLGGWRGGFRLLFEGVLGDWSWFRCCWNGLGNSDHGFGGSDGRRGFHDGRCCYGRCCYGS